MFGVCECGDPPVNPLRALVVKHLPIVLVCAIVPPVQTHMDGGHSWPRRRLAGRALLAWDVDISRFRQAPRQRSCQGRVAKRQDLAGCGRRELDREGYVGPVLRANRFERRRRPDFEPGHGTVVRASHNGHAAGVSDQMVQVTAGQQCLIVLSPLINALCTATGRVDYDHDVFQLAWLRQPGRLVLFDRLINGEVLTHDGISPVRSGELDRRRPCPVRTITVLLRSLLKSLRRKITQSADRCVPSEQDFTRERSDANQSPERYRGGRWREIMAELSKTRRRRSGL